MAGGGGDARGRRWKRGRPFPRAARSFHQPPQLAGSAAAPPAPPELTLFLPLNLTGKVSVVSVKKGRPLTKSGFFDSSLGQKGETTITQTADRRGPERLLLPFRSGPERHRRPPPARPAQGPSLRRHPLAGGGMSPHAAPARSSSAPVPLRLRHPPKRPFWWMNGPFALVIHQNDLYGG